MLLHEDNNYLKRIIFKILVKSNKKTKKVIKVIFTNIHFYGIITISVKLFGGC